MFCGKCGTQNENGAMFCQSCGAKLETAPMGAEPMGTAPKVNGETITGSDKTKSLLANKKMLLALGGGIVAIILVIVFFFGRKGGPEGAADGYFNAIKKAKGETIINYIVPESLRDEFYEEMEDEGMDKDELIDKLSDRVDFAMAQLDEFSWEIEEVESLDELDELESEGSFESLKEFRRKAEERYEDSGYDFDPDDISEAYAVEVELTAKAHGEEKSVTRYDIVYKCDGEWYIWDGFDINPF